jgi:hypothetical protein
LNPIEKIKEQRFIEATRKNLLGIKNGKLGIILRNMGDKVISHGSPLFDSSFLDNDPYEQEEEEEDFPTFDENEMTAEIGYIFDGLGRGIHIEIKYLEGNLSVIYKGHLVFMERSGDLECFIPNDEWENKVEDIYKVAIKLQRQAKKNSVVEQLKKEEKNKQSLLKHLLDKWGFKL